MIKKSVAILFLFSLVFARGQDLHFTQFYNTPTKLNPANTGAFKGDLRVVSNYRNQWSSIDSPYKTFGFSVDLPILKYKWKNSFLGLGLDVFNDRAGDLGLGSTQVDLTASNILSLNKQMTMTVGIQATFNQYNLDMTNAMTGSQFVGSGYNPSLSTGEANVFEPFSFFDVSAGATWNYASGESNIAANDMFIVNLGVAFFHLNRPNLDFINLDRMYPKIITHGSTNIGIRYFKISLMPSYMLAFQGPQKEIILGSLIRLKLREESRHTGTISEASLLFGAHYRFFDAIAPSFGVDLGDYMLLLSYDFNTSKLANATRTKGAFELT